MSKTNTADLMAMLDKARQEEEERRQRMAQRRADVSRDAIRERLVAERARSPSDVDVDSAAMSDQDKAPPQPAKAALTTSASSRSHPAAAVPDVNYNEQLGELRLELNRKTTEATQLSNRVQHLEQQLSQLETIAQEKHMEVQRLTADHEEVVANLRRDLEAAEVAARRQADPKTCVRDGVLITKEELLHVKQDIELQEKIVAALQKENETLLSERKAVVARLKKFELGAAQMEARAALNSSLSHVAADAHPAPTAPPQNEGEVAMLKLELKRCQTSEAELRLLVDQLRKEKRDAERRAAAGDSTRADAAELESRALRVQLKRQDTEHTEVVNDMARKIAWYVEHQEFNRAQEQLIQEQQETIHNLRLKLLEAESLVTKSGVVRTDKDKQIRALQRQVTELEDVIREKHPNSIAQLIRSCQPPVQHSAVFKELQGKIDQLTRELEDRDRVAQSALDRLRVESDKVRHQYHARLESLEEEMKTRVLHAQTRKVRDLEKQLADARKFYTEKLREQEAAMVLLRRGIGAPNKVGTQHSSKKHTGKTTASSSNNNTSVTNNEGDDEGHRIDGLNTSASSAKEKEQEKPVAVASPPQVVARQASSNPSADLLGVTSALQRENAMLKAQMELLATTAVNHNPSSVTEGSFRLASSLQGQLQVMQGELVATRRLLLESQEALRTKSDQYEDQIRILRQQHEREIETRMQQAESHMRVIEDKHKSELKLVLDRIDASANLAPPVSTKYASKGGAVQEYLNLVTERLQLLEHRQVAREIDAQREIDEIRRVAQFEHVVEKQKHELIVEQKNQEILRFRSELDRLLSDLASFQSC